MNYNPYRIEPPAVIHYSGGRTSGYMLRKILDAWGGKLPDGYLTVFTNTGKERTQTLDFIERTSKEWGVNVVWLEWAPPEFGLYRKVDYTTASRNGEPFEDLIRYKNFLPNPLMRLCTHHLKIACADQFISEQFGPGVSYSGITGIRYDEPKRWRYGIDPRIPRRFVEQPMVEAKATLEDVLDFWRGQPFDLGLKQHEGNCDLCFLKANAKRIQIMRDNPELAPWWIRMERVNRDRHPVDKASGAGFRSADRKNYEQLYRIALESTGPVYQDPLDQDLSDCTCTD